jgi:hemolysin III
MEPRSSLGYRARQIATPSVDRSHANDLPRWRGRSHQLALPIAIVGTVALIISAPTMLGKIAASVYGASLAGLFASSSLYNRFLGTTRIRPWMRWFDHSMIYALIAGSYTPTCLITLPRKLGVPLLAVVWGGAMLGILTKLVWKSKARVFGAALYLAIGWAAVAALPSLFSRLDTAASVLFVVGGLLYSIGAISLYLRRPNPHPELFGYHEVWHLYVVAAAGCHFVGNWLALTQ